MLIPPRPPARIAEDARPRVKIISRRLDDILSPTALYERFRAAWTARSDLDFLIAKVLAKRGHHNAFIAQIIWQSERVKERGSRAAGDKYVADTIVAARRALIMLVKPGAEAADKRGEALHVGPL